MEKSSLHAVMIACAATLWSGCSVAEDCARKVLRDLFGELEAIDIAGEERLKIALDQLAAQESWSAIERSEYTATIADNPDVDTAESNRGSMIAELFDLVQRGEIDCGRIDKLHADVLALEQAQWDAAVKLVRQRIFH